MKVILRHPRREIDVDRVGTVGALLDRLDILPSTVLVIRERELLTRDTSLDPNDTVEVRPVISGG
jgi:sulfur carrier protein